MATGTKRRGKTKPAKQPSMRSMLGEILDLLKSRTADVAKPADGPTPEFVSVGWYAKRFGLHRNTVRRAVKAGEIKSIPTPSAGDRNQIRIPYSEVTRVLMGMGDKSPEAVEAKSEPTASGL